MVPRSATVRCVVVFRVTLEETADTHIDSNTRTIIAAVEFLARGSVELDGAIAPSLGDDHLHDFHCVAEHSRMPVEIWISVNQPSTTNAVGRHCDQGLYPVPFSLEHDDLGCKRCDCNVLLRRPTQ